MITLAVDGESVGMRGEGAKEMVVAIDRGKFGLTELENGHELD